MFSLEYLIERHARAVYALATGFDDARSRLEEAHRHMLGIRLSDYPAHLRDTRSRIDALLTRLRGRKGYIIADNLRKMRKSSAVEICALIFELHMALVEHQHHLAMQDGAKC